MFKDAREGVLKNTFYFFLRSIILVAFVSIPIWAQDGIELGRTFDRGRNAIEGHIYHPSGVSAEKRFKVSLESVAVNAMFTFSDNHGVFIFRRLPSGTYRITVDAGNEYEISSETVNIIEPSRRQGDTTEITHSITVFLKVKTNQSGPIGVVNVGLAGTPSPALELYQKAQQAVKEGNKKKAIEFLEQAVRKHPQFAEAYKELGALYMTTNNLEKAIAAFKEAVRIVPDNFTHRLNYGYALLLGNRGKEAKDELLKAIVLNDKSAGAFIQLGKAQIMLKEYDDGEKTLRQAINLGGPDGTMAYRVLGVLYNDKGDLEHAVEAFEKYLNMSPNTKDVDALVKLGRAQIKLRLFDSAEKSLKQAIVIGGTEVRMAYRFLGALYIEKGDVTSAISSLEHYLNLSPNAKDVDQVRKVIEDLRRP